MPGHHRRLSVALTVASLIAGLTIASASTASADDGEWGPTGTITGRVVDEKGQPIGGAYISANSFDHPAPPDQTYYPSYVRTDSDGRYTVSPRAGHIVMSYSADGFEGRMHDGSDYIFSASRFLLQVGENRTLDIVLRRPTPTWHGPFMPVRSSYTHGLGVRLSTGGATWDTHSSIVPASELHVAYQWYRVRYVNRYTRIETPIRGATRPTYTTTAADLTQQVSLTMTATHPLLKTAVARTETDNPVMRSSAIKILSYRSPKKKHVQFKARVSAEGRPYAVGTIKVGCKIAKNKAVHYSRGVRLTKGRATVTFKPKGVTGRTKYAYCRVLYPGAKDTWGKEEKEMLHSRHGTRVTLKR